MRIGIVNDMTMAQEALRRVVLGSPGHEVAWSARDGAEALARVKADRPDLILMDLFMPKVDGVEATRRIMAECPCPIVVVTATVNGHLSKVYQAMGYGALDAVDTPSLGLGGELSGAEPLLRKIDVIGRLVGRSPEPTSALSPAPASTSTGDILGCSQSRLNTGLRPGESGTGAGPAVVRPKLEPLIVLGASTGGPHAVAEVLAGLPESILAKAGVVVVQHVDSNFAAGLGTWLGERVARRVELIEEGRRPAAGSVLLSGTNDHLLLGADRALHYSGEPSSVCYRPSVDVFFSSVARSWPRPGVAVLLTGMGRDGAEGLLTLRRAGWRTIAQDQASSVVWGMPRAAIELGAAELVLPLPRIAETIAGWVLSLLK